jgi:DNA gyrase/topoisomerase IV subunit B
MKINLEEYELILPTSITKVENNIKNFIDIEVEDNHTYHIILENSNSKILTHNCDGDSIVGLLLNFFSKWQELFDMGLIYRVMTPLLVIKKGKDKKYFYTTEEWEEFQNKNSLAGWNIEYKKGLGALEDDEYQDMIQNPRKVQIVWDEESKKYLECWFGEDAELRKKQLS